MLAVFSHFLFQLVRLVANLSIHPEVGPAVARDEDTVDYLLQILGESVVLRELEREREGKREGGRKERERETRGWGREREMKGQPHTQSCTQHTITRSHTHSHIHRSYVSLRPPTTCHQYTGHTKQPHLLFDI